MALVLATQLGVPNGAPRYDLVKGENLAQVVDALVVSTNGGMQDDLMERPSRGQRQNARRRRWINGTSPLGTPNAPDGSVTITWNTRPGAPDLLPGLCFEAPAGNNPAHTMVLMAHLIRKAPLGIGGDATLKAMYTQILDHAMTLPVGPAPLPVDAWQVRPTSIAFPLLGCRDGYGFLNSAELGLAAITEWFNDFLAGAGRRAQIVRIDLLVPEHRGSDSARIENAWRRAWDFFVAGNAPGVGGLHQPRQRLREVDRLIAEANHFTNPGVAPGAPGTRPLLMAAADDNNIIHQIGAVGGPTAVQIRSLNRVLRPRGNRTNQFSI
ncbi:hypothetical protein N431DRAFT_445340 [Stipitochalara longipes BDJ]|nr:hypothetical protein N431DRAFT_445340 [Stipitochalara longipes BDJ]